MPQYFVCFSVGQGREPARSWQGSLWAGSAPFPAPCPFHTVSSLDHLVLWGLKRGISHLSHRQHSAAISSGRISAPWGVYIYGVGVLSHACPSNLQLYPLLLGLLPLQVVIFSLGQKPVVGDPQETLTQLSFGPPALRGGWLGRLV